MSIFSTIVKALTATGVVSGAAGVGSKIYLKNGHGFGTMNVDSSSSERALDNPVIEGQAEQEQIAVTKTTYGSELEKNNYKLVDLQTEDSILLNIMMERLDPTKDKLKYTEKQRFEVNPEIIFDTKEFKSSIENTEYSLTVLQKPNSKYVEPWRNACIKALAVEVTEKEWRTQNSDQSKQMARLREWCTIPTVDHVLRRHKLTPLNTDLNNNKDEEDWKDVISGGWFKKKEANKQPWEDQAFIKDDDLTSVIGADKSGIKDKDSVTNAHIEIFKRRCKEELEKPFERTNFYLTTQFINGISADSRPKIDAFQEVALFCMKPMKASEYITKALQGKVQTQVIIPTTDYCYMSSRDFDQWTTHNPLDGKTFWCAVKALYKAQ
ncbi:hypothetical protein MHSWG343_05490 [Candidatus Mycoplasma haematohominis]|uniref:Uncharacterized protein n=1 Tax=Candidatus Mycoplasma haematohominis TaxID=1494318 RepID=A0A478FQF2_9MOLU|nr:hypothetical protein MHSWG343_05490 [Candidatus Mycoplasma haemohominis]